MAPSDFSANHLLFVRAPALPAHTRATARVLEYFLFPKDFVLHPGLRISNDPDGHRVRLAPAIWSAACSVSTEPRSDSSEHSASALLDPREGIQGREFATADPPLESFCYFWEREDAGTSQRLSVSHQPCQLLGLGTALPECHWHSRLACQPRGASREPQSDWPLISGPSKTGLPWRSNSSVAPRECFHVAP